MRALLLVCLVLTPACGERTLPAGDAGPPSDGAPPTGDSRTADLRLDAWSPGDIGLSDVPPWPLDARPVDMWVPPPPPQECYPGDRMWCDGLMYSGWGQVECDPATGKWKTKLHNGIPLLDCQELSSGEVPNTLCACYHYFFNPSCCEQPSCVVPAGASGQICPPTSGKLCDYCNPVNQPGGCVDPGAMCVVTNAHETFCTSDCSAGQTCPAGYSCMTIKTKTGTASQCVPDDFSCFY